MRLDTRGLIQTVDQGVSALINLGLSVLAARVAGLDGLGELNLVLTIYVAALGIQRAVIVEPMLVSSDAAAMRGAQQYSLLASAPFSLLLAGVGVTLSQPSLVALSLVLPFGLLVDVLRYSFFSKSAPGRALLVDIVWGLTLASSSLANLGQLEQLLLWWGAGASIAVLSGFILLTQRRWIPADRRSLSEHMRGRSKQGLIDNLILQFGWYIPLAVALGAISVDTAGEYRAAITLMAPMGVVLTSWTTSTFVGLRSASSSVPYAARRAAGILTLSLVYAVTCMLVGPYASPMIFGDDVVISSLILALVSLQIPLQSFGSQFAAWLKFHHFSWRPVIARASGTALVLPSIWGGLVLPAPVLAIAALPLGLAVYSTLLSIDFFRLRKRSE